VKRSLLVVPLWVLALSGLGVASAGCSSPQALLGQGGQCLQTTDCEQGLVCVPPPKGSTAARTCSMDLTTTVSTEEAGPGGDAAAVRDGAAQAGEGGAVRDGGASDAGSPGDATLSAEVGPAPEAQAPEAGD
jgi:hypothetical protein